MAQTATVTYDPSQTSVAELAGWVRDCGYHCAGQSVPGTHLRSPWPNPRRTPPSMIIFKRVINRPPMIITLVITT